MEDENPKVSNTWLDGLVIYSISEACMVIVDNVN